MIDLDQCFPDRMNHQPSSNHGDHHGAQLVATEEHAVLGSFHPRHHYPSLQNHHHPNHHPPSHHHHHHHNNHHHNRHHSNAVTSSLKSIDGTMASTTMLTNNKSYSNGEHYDGCLSSPIPVTPEESRSGLLQSQTMEKKMNHSGRTSVDGMSAGPRNLPPKDSRVKTDNNDSIVAISSLLKISNKTDTAGHHRPKSVSSPPVTMTTADSLRRKKKSHLSRDELARVCQLDEVTFEPYNNSTYMIAIRSKGDRKSLIGYRCDWNNCGYMNARVERMFGHIRSQHPEAPTVKKLVTTASNSASTTTTTTSTSLICSGTLTTPSATRHRSSSSLSTASLSSSSSSAASSSQSPHSAKDTKPAGASPVTTVHNNPLYRITSDDPHPPATFGANATVKVEPDDTLVASPPHGNVKRDTQLNSDKRNHHQTKNESYLFELLNGNDHGDQNNKSSMVISSDENLHNGSSVASVDQKSGSKSLLSPRPASNGPPPPPPPNHSESSDELIEELRTISHHYETNKSSSSVPSSSDLNTVDRNNNNPTPAMILNETLPTETDANDPAAAPASSAPTLAGSDAVDPVPQQTTELEKEKFALSQDDFDSLFNDINQANATNKPGTSPTSGHFEHLNPMMDASLNEPSGAMTPVAPTSSFVPEPEHTPVHGEYGDYSQYGDYPFNANGNEFGIETKSDNSQPTSNTNDSLLYETETSFDIDASLNDGSNSSHGGLGASLRKRKTGNSKNYIGKQNLFQEFQSDDVAKIRDHENKYIIALQKEQKIVGYRCDWPECEFLTCRKYVMVNHINGKHTNQRPYSCDMCNFTFVKRYFLKAHMYKVHKQRMSISGKDDDDESSKRDPSELNDFFDEGHSFDDEFPGAKKFKSDHQTSGRFYSGDKIDDVALDEFSYGSCPSNNMFEKHPGQNPPGYDGGRTKLPKSNYSDYNDPLQMPMDRCHQSDQYSNGLMGANHRQLYYKTENNDSSMIYSSSNNVSTMSSGMAMNSNLCYATNTSQSFEAETNNGSFEPYCDSYRSSSSYQNSMYPVPPPSMELNGPKSSGPLPAMDLLLTPPLTANATCCQNPLGSSESYEYVESNHHHHQQQHLPPPHSYQPPLGNGQPFEDFLSPPSSISSSGSGYSGCHTSSLPSDPLQPVRVTTTGATNGANSNTLNTRPPAMVNGNSSNTPTMLANNSSFYLHTPSPSPSSLTHSPASANTGPPMFPTETNYPPMSKMAQPSHYQTNFTDSFNRQTDANVYPAASKPQFHGPQYDYGFNGTNSSYTGTLPPPPPPPPAPQSSYNRKNYCDSDFNVFGQSQQTLANSQEPTMAYDNGEQMEPSSQQRNQHDANFVSPDCWMSSSPW